MKITDTELPELIKYLPKTSQDRIRHKIEYAFSLGVRYGKILAKDDRLFKDSIHSIIDRSYDIFRDFRGYDYVYMEEELKFLEQSVPEIVKKYNSEIKELKLNIDSRNPMGVIICCKNILNKQEQEKLNDHE
jgi:hypothetical protein